MRRERLTRLVGHLFLAAVLYAALSLFAYHWRHPEQSSMEALQNLGEALLWR